MAINRKFANPSGGAYKELKPEGKVIIQCPKCQTKFSVSSELISELELPRFHCSRCDNVFDMDPRTSASFEESDIPEENPPYIERLQSESSITASTPEKSEDASKTVEISKEDLSKISETLESQKAEQPLSLQIPSSYEPAAPASAPIENLSSSKEIQLSMDLTSTKDTVIDKENFDMPYGVSIGKALDGTEEVSAPYPAPNQEREIERVFDLPRQSAWSGPIILVVPIMLTLMFSAVLSVVLIKSPQIAESVANTLGAPLPKVPPTGLYLESIEFKNYVLDNGEQVSAISGAIRNASPNRFKNILIEGFAFDRDGNIVGNVKTSTASNLNDARIKSLSLAMLKDLQESSSGKKSELAPNSDKSFLIPILGDNKQISTAHFFTARIYSVTM